MKLVFTMMTLLVFTMNAKADDLKDILGMITDGSGERITISLVHQASSGEACISEAKVLAEGNAVTACSTEFGKSCELDGEPQVTRLPQVAVQPNVVRNYKYETNKKKKCHTNALPKARDYALSECRKIYGSAASCEIIDVTPIGQPKKDISGLGKKYYCYVRAIAEPTRVVNQNSYECELSATAKTKENLVDTAKKIFGNFNF